MEFIVTTPANPQYARKVYGIQFNNGRAIIADEVLDKQVGLSAEEIAKRMEQEFGFVVRPLKRPIAAALVGAPSGASGASRKGKGATGAKKPKAPPRAEPTATPPAPRGEGRYKVKEEHQ